MKADKECSELHIEDPRLMIEPLQVPMHNTRSHILAKGTGLFVESVVQSSMFGPFTFS